MTKKLRELHRARMGAIPASTLAFDVDKQKTDDYGKPPQQIPKSLSTDAAGTSTSVPGLFFPKLPTMKRRWWSKHRLFPDAHGAGDPRPSQATVPSRVLAEVLLVIFLGIIKLRSLPNLRGDGAKAFLLQHLSGKTTESH